MTDYLAGPQFGHYRCRHGVLGDCNLCAFPDDAFAPFYAGTKIPRTPPSQMEIALASEDVWTPQEPIRRLPTQRQEN